MKKNDKVLVMTSTTHYWLGKVVSVDAFSVALRESTWIPEIGRHHHVLGTGKPDRHTEIEPHPDGMIVRVPRIGSVIFDWPYPLWREAKTAS